MKRYWQHAFRTVLRSTSGICSLVYLILEGTQVAALVYLILEGTQVAAERCLDK